MTIVLTYRTENTRRSLLPHSAATGAMSSPSVKVEDDDASARTGDKQSFSVAEAFARASSETEAAAPSVDGETPKDPKAKVEAALACPCVADLRQSSCGTDFDEALTCFMLAKDEEKGKKCVEEFVSLHACMVKNASEFKEFADELLEHQEVRGPARAPSKTSK
jgi:intermembrane space import and assembly protein 40